MAAGKCTPFGALCQAVYRQNRPFSSQPKFTIGLLQAAGASTQGVSDYLATKFYRGERSLTVNFPKELDEERLVAFFRKCVELPKTTEEDRLARCDEISRAMTSPIDCPINREHFYIALAYYTEDLVHAFQGMGTLADYYKQSFESRERRIQASGQPMHPGDHASNVSFGSRSPIKLRTYEEVKYSFKLLNDGSVEWRGRTLQCTNPTDDLLRPEQSTVSVSDTAPSRFLAIDVPVTLRAQHMEGDAQSRWVMLDEEGHDCFPNDPDRFVIYATITFVPGEEDDA